MCCGGRNLASEEVGFLYSSESTVPNKNITLYLVIPFSIPSSTT